MFEDQQKNFQAYAVYDLTVETAAGIKPAVHGESGDTRDLGVFVRPVLPSPR